ncbi:transposase [Simkania negevensis]|uniref:Transposase n=1 Tax=Simkania negevensis TaxID=83561 RepID=A0ABS3AT51_9BACT|nr:transposase [Simkania negevensis]
MTWRASSVEKIRLEFIKNYLLSVENFSTLCKQYDISRTTGYKWLRRYHEGGAKNLFDQSRRPKKRPNDTERAIVKLIIDTRERFPHWGAKKIIPYLMSKHTNLELPSTATIGNILKRNGYTVKGKRRPSIGGTAPLVSPEYPNHVWTMDFKGWWKTKNDKICEPFTVCDAHSRYVLYCEPVRRKNASSIWKILDDLFLKYGLPERFRSDNGPPFASIGVGRLTSLSINLIKAGVIPEWTRVGKPQDNGRHERMHRTMNREVALEPASTLEKQREQLKEFQIYYNSIRPHEALANQTPAQVYRPSNKRWDRIKRLPKYPAEHLIRKVDSSGQISLHGHVFFISERLQGEYIGLEELSKGVFKLSYGEICLGTFDFLNGFERF